MRLEDERWYIANNVTMQKLCNNKLRKNLPRTEPAGSSTGVYCESCYNAEVV